MMYIYVHILWKYYFKLCQILATVEKLILSDLRVDTDTFSSFLKYTNHCSRASLIAQLVKSLPAMQQTQVRFMGWEDPLEEELITYSSILAWRISWTKEHSRLQSMGSQESDMTESQHTQPLFYI